MLSELEDVGGLEHCEAEDTAKSILKWMVLCYVGEPGGYGDWGRHRAVFYSDTAAPIIKRIVKRSSERDLKLLKSLQESSTVKAALGRSRPVGERYEHLLDEAGDV